MARTRGLGTTVRRPEYDDDGGVLLGKGDEPLSPIPVRLTLPRQDEPPAAAAPPPEPSPMPVPVYGYRCDKKTWLRSMEAFELAQLLQVLLGTELSAILDADSWAKLSPDVKRHFHRVPLQ